MTSLRRRLVAWLLPPLVVVGVVAAAGAYVFMDRRLAAAYDQGLGDIARGEDQHRLLAAGRAQALQPRESVHPGEADVEDDDRDIGNFDGGLGALGARHRIHDVAFAAQRIREAAREQRIVFDDEDAHGVGA